MEIICNKKTLAMTIEYFFDLSFCESEIVYDLVMPQLEELEYQRNVYIFDFMACAEKEANRISAIKNMYSEIIDSDNDEYYPIVPVIRQLLGVIDNNENSIEMLLSKYVKARNTRRKRKVI